MRSSKGAPLNRRFRSHRTFGCPCRNCSIIRAKTRGGGGRRSGGFGDDFYQGVPFRLIEQALTWFGPFSEEVVLITMK